MSFPRRRFLQWAASMTTLAVARNGRSSALRLLDGTGAPDLQPTIRLYSSTKLSAGGAGGRVHREAEPRGLHSQIEVFAKVIHKIDAMSAAQLKGA
jgi:hypothetical protein